MARAKKKSNYINYVGFYTEKAGSIGADVIINPELPVIQEWKERRLQRASAGPEKPDGDRKPSVERPTTESAPADQPETPDDRLGALMPAIVGAMAGYRPLIDMGPGLLGVMKLGYVQHVMLEDAKNFLDPIEEVGGVIIYGVDESGNAKIDQWHNNIVQMDNSISAIPGATLLSLVATFDSYIVDIVRVMLKARPNALSATRLLSVKEILEMASFEDVIEKVVDDEVHSLMRGSHGDQVKYLEDTFNVKIRGEFERWGEFIEIFERRNLAAHGNMIVNRRYITNCSENKCATEVSLGEKLPLSQEYLTSASIILTEFLLLLVFVLWRKNYPESSPAAFGKLNEISFKLIKDRRYNLAEKLLDFALNKQSHGRVPDKTIKMMIVNRANALKKSDEEGQAYKVLNSVDWSALSDEFKICVASIRGEVDEVVRIMPVLKQTGSIDKEDFREWPVFDWVRNEEKVQSKFEELYGEALNIVPKNTAKVDGVQIVEPGEQGARADQKLH